MAEFIVRDSLASDIKELEKGLRYNDRIEVTCSDISIWRAFRRSLIARTALVDGEIAVMGGASGSALSGQGEIWLLTTGAVERMPLAFVKAARLELARTLMIFPRVHGHVLASYTRACGFLCLLGFDLSEPFPIAEGGPLFRRYFVGDPA